MGQNEVITLSVSKMNKNDQFTFIVWDALLHIGNRKKQNQNAWCTCQIGNEQRFNSTSLIR